MTRIAYRRHANSFTVAQHFCLARSGRLSKIGCDSRSTYAWPLLLPHVFSRIFQNSLHFARTIQCNVHHVANPTEMSVQCYKSVHPWKSLSLPSCFPIQSKRTIYLDLSLLSKSNIVPPISNIVELIFMQSFQSCGVIHQSQEFISVT
jgi:hypothetical protein